MSLRFDFYGLVVTVRCAEPSVLEEVRRDFTYFLEPESTAAGGTEGLPGLRVNMHLATPPYTSLPSLPAAFLTPRNICYRDGSTSYIDYFGRGLAVFDREGGTCEAHSPDPHLLREIVYLLILSTVGEHLDGRGLHRIHALGVNHRGHGVLLLLPSGGGKSTMAMALLRTGDVSLLSEDTPLVDRRGRIHPFPLCIGIRNGSDPGVPRKYVRTVRRMEFDPKQLIDLEYFDDRVSGPVEPALIIVGERSLGEDSAIRPIPRHQALRALLKYMVVGLGVYQGLEFLLERGTRELFGKSGVAASRLYNGLQLLCRAPAYRFTLGRDTTKNATTCLEFIERRAEGV